MFFSNDTSSFLLLLALGASFPMMLGFFFVRPIPLPEEEKPVVNHEAYSEITSPLAHEQHDTGHTRLLDQDYLEGDRQIGGRDSNDTTPIPPSRSQNGERLSRRAALALGMLPNVYGKRLWFSSDFWLLFTLLSICALTCLFSTSSASLTACFLVSGSGMMCMSHQKIFEICLC